VHLVDAALDLGIDLVASAPLMQGQLTKDLPTEVREALPGETDAQRALAFSRGVRGVIAVAVGMRSRAHLHENVRRTS
jgi:aryl-alcohol dehydrogenase-like predicted oxidoreductase